MNRFFRGRWFPVRWLVTTVCPRDLLYGLSASVSLVKHQHSEQHDKHCSNSINVKGRLEPAIGRFRLRRSLCSLRWDQNEKGARITEKEFSPEVAQLADWILNGHDFTVVARFD